MGTKVKKIAHITYTKNYGNKRNRAWVIQESFNGETDSFIKVLKREYFNDLQEVIQEYLERGFTIEITDPNDELLNV